MAALRVGAVNLVRSRLDVYEAVAEVSGRQVLDSAKNHERSVPFPDFLVLSMSALMAGKRLDDYIFVGETGEPIRVSTFRPRAFRPAVVRCQSADPLFPTITPHDLRHYADGRVMRPAGSCRGVTNGFDVSLSA